MKEETMDSSSSSSPFNPKNPTTPTFRSPASRNDLSRRTMSFTSTITYYHSISSPSSSSSSHLSSPFTPPSPFTPTSSTIPFSWEKQPGIPKTRPDKPKSPDYATLPLPPPLRSNSDTFLSLPRKKRSSYIDKYGFARDPFAVALMECSKEKEHWKMASSAPPPRRGRRVANLTDRFGFRSLDLYASCKTTCSVTDSMVYIPRSGRDMAAYNLLNRR